MLLNISRMTGLILFLIVSPTLLFSQDQTREQLALEYYNAGEFEKAAELYREIFNTNQTTYYYTYYLNSLLESENFREAERLVKGLKPTRQLRRNFTVELGYIYQLQGEFRKAEREFERAIDRLEPTRFDIIGLANAFMLRRLPDYAIKTYLKGRRIIREPYPFHMELAGVYQSTRNFSAMMDEYLDLLESDESRLTTVQNILQNLLNNIGDEAFHQIVRGKLVERAQRDPDNYVFSEILMWFSIQQKEFSLALAQAKALERRTRDEGELVFRVGELASSNEFYDVAIDAFKHIKKKGENHFLYLSAEIKLLEVRYSKLMKQGDFTTQQLRVMENEYKSVLESMGKNASTIVLMRNLAHLKAFYLDKIEEAIDLLEYALKMPNLRPTVVAQCKIDLADIFLMNGEVWEATLLYSQVEKEFKYDPVGFEAKLKNAKLSFYIGEFDWARIQLDVLRAATSKLIANDAMELSLLISDNIEDEINTLPLELYAEAELLAFRKNHVKALMLLDSIERSFPGHNIQDEVLLRKAKIMIEKRKYHVADSLLDFLSANYGHDILADNALIIRARLNEYQLDNRAKAIELYETLIMDHPGSVFISEARRRYTKLRRHQVN